MKNMEIQINDIWNNKRKRKLRKFITYHSATQSKETLQTNELLSIQSEKAEDWWATKSRIEQLQLTQKYKEVANKISFRDFTIFVYHSETQKV